MRAALAALLLAGAATGTGASASEPAMVTVDLNRLEPTGAGCRAYVVLENRADSAFETLKLDLVLFDPDGVVARRIALETAPLPAGKTRLKVFDIAGIGCDDIGRAMLNDVLDCVDGSGPRRDCLELLQATSRSAVPFIE